MIGSAPQDDVASSSRGVAANRHETMEEVPTRARSCPLGGGTPTGRDAKRHETTEKRTKCAPRWFNNSDRRDLYFVRNRRVGIIKIGIASDVPLRVSQIEGACGMSMELLAVFRGDAAFEPHLHTALGDSRLLGEWFDSTAELLDLIANPKSIVEFLAYAEDRDRVRAANENGGAGESGGLLNLESGR